MKNINSTVAVLGALIVAPTVASADDYGFHERRMNVGVSLGVGGMSDRGGSVECVNCNYGTFSGEFAAHLGGFVAPRVALMAELQFNAQTLATDGRDDTVLVQTGLMGAVQGWVAPRFWLKGGLGLAHLTIDDSYFNMTVDNGIAIMGAAATSWRHRERSPSTFRAECSTACTAASTTTSPRTRSASGPTGSDLRTAGHDDLSHRLSGRAGRCFVEATGEHTPPP